jgi:DsbC/DsbD-like thiol-disulfide interchange protein
MVQSNANVASPKSNGQRRAVPQRSGAEARGSLIAVHFRELRRRLGAAFLFLSIQKTSNVPRGDMKRDWKFMGTRPVATGIFALTVCASCAFGQAQASGPHTTVTLLANGRALAAGETFLAGLQFKIEKGWHVYWQNPGDSGEPPKIQWQMPGGFRAGAMEWPAPKKLTAPSIVDYGYEDEVLLVVPVRTPQTLKRGETETLGARVNWLVCREMCIPGKAQLSLALPVAGRDAGNAATEELFRKARAELPVHALATWRVYATSEKDDFVLTIETGKQESAATFFPLDAEQINNDAPQTVTPFSRGVRLRLQKSDGLLKPIARLRGVLELGSGRAYEITAPVYASPKTNS